MKVAYITDNFTGNAGNGITSQALTWASLLKSYCSLDVDLINQWEKHSWDDTCVIHLFGSSGTWFYETAQYLKNKGCKVVWSPICDDPGSPFMQKLKTKLGFKKGGIFSYPYTRNRAYKVFDKIFVRSKYEKKYIMNAYGVPECKFAYVPLSISYVSGEMSNNERENFCLHISSISQPRKNVLNLIKAAKKYKFNLVLAGNKGNDNEFSIIAKEIGLATNIKVLGFISEEEKLQLYSKAKVFALPSRNEGVGIVALDAAHFGCDVVITKVGGPHEYYGGFAKVVDPYNIDEIGEAILSLMTETFQPKLKMHVDALYSQNIIADRLLKEYLSCFK